VEASVWRAVGGRQILAARLLLFVRPMRPRRLLRRRTVHAIVAAVVTFSAVVLADLSSVTAPAPASDRPAHHVGRGFRNLDPGYAYSLSSRVLHVIGRRPPYDRGRALEVVANDGAALRGPQPAPTVTWIGHSTFLVQLDGVNLLTDPIWSERTSPVAFAGPRRLVPPGLRFEDLPRVHVVLISHDHYDHLDVMTVLRLARTHRPTFFVPTGLRAWFAALNITEVVELDWWESARLGPILVTAVPAQHSSGRSLALTDQNARLWTSWAVTAADRRFFFAGDTGYHAGLAEIGRRLGPFDLAALPIGGYSDFDRHHPNHLSPEEAVQAFEDLRGRLLAPMHWGTFELNREPFREPPDRLMAEALRRGLEERVAALSPGQTIHW
jgi:N-acyl-phosphatidylethanolamine-hydrolysing phospholipase D